LVQGVITDLDGNPVIDVFVTVSQEFCIPDRTDEQGNFEIQKITTGSKKLITYGETASNGLFASVSFEFNIQTDHIFENTINLPKFEETYSLNEDNIEEYTITTNDDLNITILPNALQLAPFAPSELQIARVPVNKAPSFIPDNIQLIDLFVLHPILSTLDPPSPISFPKDTELPIGTEVNFYGLDYELGKLVPVASGVVDENGYPKTNDGQGIPELTWIGLSIKEEE
jgi:hypothetical protein